MPEVYVVEMKRKIPTLTIVTPETSVSATIRMKCKGGTSVTETRTAFIQDEKWGFRITGGAEFGMPITVFHVNIIFLFVYDSFIVLHEFSKTLSFKCNFV